MMRLRLHRSMPALQRMGAAAANGACGRCAMPPRFANKITIRPAEGTVA